MSNLKSPVKSRDIPVILPALWDAAQWNDSLADAHYYSLQPGNRTKENTAVSMRAIKLSKRYIAIHDRISNALKKNPESKQSRVSQ